jgi:p21-activated kinase 1
MDSQSTISNGNSQRRKLVKKPPSHHHTRSSSGLDGGIDAQSLQSKRSSQSLKRAPSAPPARTTPSNASNNSSPRHPPSTAQRSNPSPILPTGDFTTLSSYANPPSVTRSRDRNSDVLQPALSSERLSTAPPSLTESRLPSRRSCRSRHSTAKTCRRRLSRQAPTPAS